jgi:hypothetical protein
MLTLTGGMAMRQSMSSGSLTYEKLQEKQYRVERGAWIDASASQARAIPALKFRWSENDRYSVRYVREMYLLQCLPITQTPAR